MNQQDLSKDFETASKDHHRNADIRRRLIATKAWETNDKY